MANKDDLLRRSQAMNAQSREVLNAYEVTNPHELAWAVNTYYFERTDGLNSGKADRSKIVDATWQLKRQHKESCRGYGFVCGIDEHTIAVPARWELPSGVEVGDYYVTAADSFTVNLHDPEHELYSAKILEEGIKKHFKDNGSEGLGALWQYFGDFCQMPSDASPGQYRFCRKFSAKPKFLNGIVALQFSVTTVTLDGRTLDWYYSEGKVHQVVQLMNLKRENRTTRQGEDISIKVWQDERSSCQDRARVLDIDDIDGVILDSKLVVDEQKSLSDGCISCSQFKRPPEEVPMKQLRLILDTQITQGEHRETIMCPEKRHSLKSQLRTFFDGADICGSKLVLSANPLQATHFNVKKILPPSTRVKTPDGVRTIDAPREFSSDSINRRARERAACVRRYGFLQDRPINPALAWPALVKNDVAMRRMRNDLNMILDKRRIPYSYQAFSYNLKKQAIAKSYDALLVVLPDEQNGIDWHEEIKKRVELPTQCIKVQNTLPSKWVTQRRTVLRKQDARLFNSLQNRYELCVDNLFVKHNWIPFFPATAFNYNVHVGIDVGGRINNKVVASVGHGLSSSGDVLFKLQEIVVNIGKAEPIPTQSLVDGLRQLFDSVISDLEACSIKTDFERVLFFRDGNLAEADGGFNERQALLTLHDEYLRKGVVTQNSTWSVLEIHKRAERWRVFSQGSSVENPLVGYCLLDFGDSNEALVCTTGRPYLHQGTASPLKVRLSDIYGCSVMEEAIEDLVWEADMGFTKPDMGRGVPWILHIADTGALQVSRAYKITGITA